MKMLNKYFVIFGLIVLGENVCAQNTSVPKSHFDDKKWVEYVEGNIPVVISVPHGGRITADSIPVRSCEGAITTVDMYTIELAKEIQRYFITNYNVTPHIVIAHLARKHVDQNRELNRGGTCGNKALESVWHSFHNFVDKAINNASGDAKGVVYIDLHGHAHEKQRLEVGYNIQTEALVELKQGKLPQNHHGLTNLLKINPKLSLTDLVFGSNAFGSLVHHNGAAAVPGKQDQIPLQDDRYFYSGPNTRRFTSSKYPNVFGFQLECNREARFNLAQRKTTASAIVTSLEAYLAYTLQYKIKK